MTAKRKVFENRCQHVERLGLALGRGHTVIGGVKTGQCEREALPELVFCEDHASPAAMGMVIRQLAGRKQ